MMSVQTEMLLRIKGSTYISARHKHRLENSDIIPLVLIEVESGECLGEDSILNFEGSYGRC